MIMKIFTDPGQREDAGKLIPVPDSIDRSYLIPWATPECRSYNFGMILTQEFVHKYYIINSYYCDIREKAVVYPYFEKPAIAMQVFLKGSVRSINNGTGDLDLPAGNLSLVYIPAGVHHVQFTSDTIEACLLLFEPNYLAELTEGWPMQQQLLDLINHSSETGMPFPSARLNYQCIQEIYRMRSSRKSGYLLILELKSCISNLLGYYLTSIEERSYLQSLSHVPNKDIVIRVYETIKAEANLHDKDLAALAKANNIHIKTLSRNFKAIFNISLLDFTREQRMQKAYVLVTSTEIPLEDIAFELKYSTVTNFARAFRLKFNATPQALRSLPR